MVTALPATGVLPASRIDGQVLGQAHCGEHLLLLRPDFLGCEVDRFLHGGQRHQLKQMVLNDVAGRADAVVVARTRADADVLGHRDLHGIDVVCFPQGFEHGIREAHRHDVLDGFLAQVVVDAEDVLLVEDLRDDVGELLRGAKVVAERLLDDDAAPFAALALVEARVGQVLGHDGEV